MCESFAGGLTLSMRVSERSLLILTMTVIKETVLAVGLYPFSEMQCKYTNFSIERRFGVPQTNDENHLVGCFASVGVVIRYVLDRVEEEKGAYTSNTLGMIARIGKMIGKPLTIKRTVKEGGEAELTFSSSELSEIVKLAAPSSKDLEINGGKLSRKEYLARDPTSGPDYHKFGQTKEEFERQKEETRKKKEETRKKKEYSDSDHARYFFFATPETGGEKLKDVMSRVTLSAVEEVKFLENSNKKVHIVEVGKTGLRVAYCGGNTHNKLATKKFWGKDWRDKPMLKGDVLIVCTGNAPLNIDEAMPPDDDWVKKRSASDAAVATVTASNKKQKK